MRPSDRRALLRGGWVVIAALAGLGVGPAVRRDLAARRERVIAKTAWVQDTKRELAALPGLEDSAREVTARLAGLAPRLLGAGTMAQGHAELEARLRSIASLHHAQVVDFVGLPDSGSAGRLRRVRGRLALVTDFKGLAELLAVLERQPLALLPERLAIRAEAPEQAAGEPERLDVQLEVSAWFLLDPEEASSGRPGRAGEEPS